MDYEKKYKESIERAKKWRLTHKLCVEDIFPELAESEDERIRKEMLEYFKQFKDGELRGVDINDWIAYLERKKENEKKEETEDNKWPNLSNCPHNCKTCMAKCWYRKEEYQAPSVTKENNSELKAEIQRRIDAAVFNQASSDADRVKKGMVQAETLRSLLSYIELAEKENKTL